MPLRHVNNAFDMISAFNLYLKGGSMKDMDYDAKPQYTVTAVCTDDYGLATEKIFYVNVEKNIEPVINVLPSKW